VATVACGGTRVVWKRAEKFVEAYPKYCGVVVFGRFGGVINLRLSLSASRVCHKTRQGARRGRGCVCDGGCERAGKKQCYTHMHTARRILALTV